MNKHRAAAFFVALQVILAVTMTVPVAAQEGGTKDCSQTSTGQVPIMDLGTDTYQGQEGGLYPGGSNEVPADHEALGLWRASQIVPRDAAGDPDPGGTIVLLSIGVSNTRMEWQNLRRQAVDAVAPDVTIVNGSQPGEDVSTWQDVAGEPWIGIEGLLANNDVTPEQVQAAWIMLPESVDSVAEIPPFPEDAQTYRDELAVVVRNAMDHFPNLQVAYLSSRMYAGYNTTGRPNPEPLAYEEGFGVKWLIGDQIEGDLSLNTDERRGEVEAPWLAWGPYTWADGMSPRSDGLIWECDDVQDDGIHPSPSGGAKIGAMLLEHFTTAATAAPWFSGVGEPIGAVTLPPVVPGVTTTTAETPTTSTTTTTAASDVTTTTERSFSGSDRPGPPDRTDREAERAARADERTASRSDMSWLVGTVAALALILALVALVGSRRRRRNRDVASDSTGGGGVASPGDGQVGPTGSSYSP